MSELPPDELTEEEELEVKRYGLEEVAQWSRKRVDRENKGEHKWQRKRFWVREMRMYLALERAEHERAEEEVLRRQAGDG